MGENPPPPPLPRRRTRRWPLILCLTLFAFTAGVIPGFYLIEKIRGKLAWRAYERDAQKRGVKLADGRFVLYSVGADLKDDGGEIHPSLTGSKQKDWVWQYPTR